MTIFTTTITALNTIIADLQNRYGKRLTHFEDQSQEWRESEDGLSYNDANELLDEAITDLENSVLNLEELSKD